MQYSAVNCNAVSVQLVMWLARGAWALGLNGTPNRRPLFYAVKLYSTLFKCILHRIAPFKCFRHPPLAALFAMELNLKLCKRNKPPPPLHFVALIIKCLAEKKKCKGGGWKSIYLRPPGQLGSLSALGLKPIPLAKAGQLFLPPKQHHLQCIQHPCLKMLVLLQFTTLQTEEQFSGAKDSSGTVDTSLQRQLIGDQN